MPSPYRPLPPEERTETRREALARKLRGFLKPTVRSSRRPPTVTEVVFLVLLFALVAGTIGARMIAHVRV